MKTAEEWYVEQVGRPDMDWNVEFSCKKDYIRHIEEIQLDAMKEGMRRAATLPATYGDSSQCLIEQRDILTTAEQLTEKDL